MDSIAKEFLEPDKMNMSIEETLDFIIDNYSSLLRMFRIMEAHKIETANKKENAHYKLKELREKESKIKKSGKYLTEQEKLFIQESKEHLQRVREENDPVYIDGHIMEHNYHSYIILKYYKLFTFIEKYDRKIRNSFVNKFVSGSDIIFTIVEKGLKLTSANKKSLKSIKRTRKNFKRNLKHTLLRNVNIDLSLHKP